MIFYTSQKWQKRWLFQWTRVAFRDLERSSTNLCHKVPAAPQPRTSVRVGAVTARTHARAHNKLCAAHRWSPPALRNGAFPVRPDFPSVITHWLYTFGFTGSQTHRKHTSNNTSTFHIWTCLPLKLLRVSCAELDTVASAGSVSPG